MNSCSDVPVSRFQIVSPLPGEFLPHVWNWAHEFQSQMLSDASPTCPIVFSRMHDEMMANGGKTYGLFSGDGTFIGVLWGDFLGDGQFGGHLVFSRELSSADKLEASRAVLSRWFAEGARKIYWELFIDNDPFRKFLQKLGATIEGRHRDGARRNGKLVDTLVMASFPEDLQ